MDRNRILSVIDAINAKKPLYVIDGIYPSKMEGVYSLYRNNDKNILYVKSSLTGDYQGLCRLFKIDDVYLTMQDAIKAHIEKLNALANEYENNNIKC